MPPIYCMPIHVWGSGYLISLNLYIFISDGNLVTLLRFWNDIFFNCVIITNSFIP